MYGLGDKAFSTGGDIVYICNDLLEESKWREFYSTFYSHLHL
jgi:hypothetical protein